MDIFQSYLLIKLSLARVSERKLTTDEKQQQQRVNTQHQTIKTNKNEQFHEFFLRHTKHRYNKQKFTFEMLLLYLPFQHTIQQAQHPC